VQSLPVLHVNINQPERLVEDKHSSLFSRNAKSFIKRFCSSLPKRQISYSVCVTNTKGSSITVLLTSCLTGLESAV
jgi:hypothetical protein